MSEMDIKQRNKAHTTLLELGYVIPMNLRDRKSTRRFLEDMHPDELDNMYQLVERELNILKGMIDVVKKNRVYSNCEICSFSGWGQTDIPKDWGYIKAHDRNLLICDGCMERYKIRFGEKPELAKEFENV